MVGVFQKGQPPFVVNNNTVTDVSAEQMKSVKDDIQKNKGKPSDFDKPIGHQRLMEKVFRDAGHTDATQSAPTYEGTESAWRKANRMPD